MNTSARVFLDTAALIALINPRDSLQPSTIRILKALRDQGTSFLTTEFILLELADALSSPSVRMRAVHFVDGLRGDPSIDVVPADSELLSAGWELFRGRPDKGWGLTDCISFAVMACEGLTHAFTSDHHYEQAGFVRLLMPE